MLSGKCEGVSVHVMRSLYVNCCLASLCFEVSGDPISLPSVCIHTFIHVWVSGGQNQLHQSSNLFVCR